MMQMGNKGAFIRFTAPDLKPDIVSFSAVVSIRLFRVHIMHSRSLNNDTSFCQYFWSIWRLVWAKSDLLCLWFAAASRCEANGICKQFFPDVFMIYQIGFYNNQAYSILYLASLRTHFHSCSWTVMLNFAQAVLFCCLSTVPLIITLSRATPCYYFIFSFFNVNFSPFPPSKVGRRGAHCLMI